jgi:pyruvate dehydrogenase E2 component (dihydrolipoamide acetyltransferase)
MSSRDFKLPDLGEGVHEGQIIKVMIKPGDAIREDQPLMEVETDKAAVVIPSPFAGVVEKIHVRDGQMVHVGDVMVTFGDSKELASQSIAGEAGSATSVTRAETARAAKTHAAFSKPQAAVETHRKAASPAVRKLARSMGIDIESIKGSGPGGRVERQDIEAAGNARTTAALVARMASHQPSATPSTKAAPAPSAPRPHVTPVPPNRAATPSAPAPPVIAARVAYPAVPESTIIEPPLAPGGEDASDAYGPVRKSPLTMARKTIAAVVAQSWSTIPHATDFDDADVTELDKIRRGYTSLDDPSSGRTLTMLAFVVRAVVRALQRFPEFNASIDIENNQVIYKRYFNIAIGVHTERGLVPLVMRDADRKSIPQISDELAVMGEKARTASFAVNDTRGGTYTISNAGAMGGSRYSTPIITPPQVAVLAIGRTRWMPWVTEQENQRGIAPRLIMPLSHSIDHRLLDGGQEVQFMQHVIGDLQNPARLLL